MNVLAISGSPRENGNTAWLLDQIVSTIGKHGIESNLVKLVNYKMEMCSGCLQCESSTKLGSCEYDDDMMKVIFPRLLRADALILGTPSYFDMPSALMKNFIDRSNVILSSVYERQLPYALVVVGQTDMKSLNNVLRSMRRYCSIANMHEIRGSVVRVIARDIGDAARGQSSFDKVSVSARRITEYVNGEK